MGYSTGSPSSDEGRVRAVLWFALWLADPNANGTDPPRPLIGISGVIGPMFVITGAMIPMMKVGTLPDSKVAVVAAKRLFKIFDRASLIDPMGEGGTGGKSVSGEIVVKDVVFAYPTAPDHNVCKGYSLTIPRPDGRACGPSGSGKSTIIQLIERFYDLSLAWCCLTALTSRRSTSSGLLAVGPGRAGAGALSGHCPRTSPVVSRWYATKEEIEAAAKKANAHDFIMESLPEGYGSEVGLRGGRLSGGQSSASR